jgi:hypothetical protein
LKPFFKIYYDVNLKPHVVKCTWGKDLSFTWLHFHSIQFIWIYCDKSLEKMKHAIWWLFSIWTLEANVFELVIWIFFVEQVFKIRFYKMVFICWLCIRNHIIIYNMHKICEFLYLKYICTTCTFFWAIWKMGTISVKSLTFKCITFCWNKFTKACK